MAKPLSTLAHFEAEEALLWGRDGVGWGNIECLTLLTALWLTIGQPRSWVAHPVPGSLKSGKFMNFDFTTPQLKLAKNDN